MRKLYVACIAIGFAAVYAWAALSSFPPIQQEQEPLGAAQHSNRIAPANITITCAPLTVPCLVEDFTPDTLFQKYGLSASFPTTAGGSGSLILSFQDDYQELGCQDVVNGVSNLAAHISRTWTATDSAGVTASCTQDIYIRRIALDELQWIDTLLENCLVNFIDIKTPPYILFQNVRLELEPGNNVCGINVSVVDDLLPGPCDGALAVSRMWVVNDACAPFNPDPNYTGELIFSQYILLKDTDGPLFSCPSNDTLIIPGTDCAYNLLFDSILVTSNCSSIDSFVVQLSGGPQTLRFKATLNPILPPVEVSAHPGTFMLATGNYTVTYTAFDNCGLSAACTFNLVVYDTIQPPIQFNAFTDSIPVSLGQVPAQLFDNGSADSCGTKFYFKARRKAPSACQGATLFTDFISLCCEEAGDTLEIEFRVYDRPIPSGPVSADTLLAHSRTATVLMAVYDTEAPTCVSAPDVAVSCTQFDATLASYPLGAYGDNCCLDSTQSYLNNAGVSGSIDYSAFDSTCNQGVITRTYAVHDCNGNQTQCSDRIVVTNANDYYLRFPNDTLVYACQDSLYTGEITFGNAGCQTFAINFADVRDTVLYPNQSLLIRRTWSVRNDCRYDPDLPCILVPNPDTLPGLPSVFNGPVLAPDSAAAPWQPSVLFAAPGDTAATTYSQYWSDTANCYQYVQLIVVRDTAPPVFSPPCLLAPQALCFTDANNPDFWNDPLFKDAAHNNAQDLCEGAISLSIQADDACSDVAYAAILFLDLDGNGIAETRIDSRDLPTPGTVMFDNISGAGQIATIDARPIPADDKIQLAIINNGDSVVLSWREGAGFSPLFLPAGKHSIRWIATDQAGNSAECAYDFELKDCGKPLPQCIGVILTEELPILGPLTVTASQILVDATDNCTPAPLIRTGIRRSGTGFGFPFAANGIEGIQSVQFDCNDLGTQLVELWAIDVAGNTQFCEVIVQIVDSLNVCDPNNPIGGYVRTEQGMGVENVLVEFFANMPPFVNTAITDADGFYSLAGIQPPPGANFGITPFYDEFHLNGVSTFDIVLINKHILGQELLASPYKLIAADANKSGTITTFDIFLLRQLILGIINMFPSNTSWRFVPESHVFGNPQNPWDANFPPFPEQILITSPNDLLGNLNFVAVKVGDVNNSAAPFADNDLDDRAPSWVSARLSPDAQDPRLTRLRLTPPPGLSAWQATLEWPQGVQLLAVMPGEGQTADQFGLFADALTWAIDHSGDGFELLIEAKDPALLEKISLSDRTTPARTYDHTGRAARPVLLFEKKRQPTFALFDPSPNPWTQSVSLGFSLSQAGNATLRVCDHLGREIWRERRAFNEAGPQVFFLDASKIVYPGLYFYTIETDAGSGSGKFIKGGD